MIVYHEGEPFQNSIASTLGFSGKIKLSGKGITTLLQGFLLIRNVVFLPKNFCWKIIFTAERVKSISSAYKDHLNRNLYKSSICTFLRTIND